VLREKIGKIRDVFDITKSPRVLTTQDENHNRVNTAASDLHPFNETINLQFNQGTFKETTSKPMSKQTSKKKLSSTKQGKKRANEANGEKRKTIAKRNVSAKPI
jgi:hypothetical protein